MPSVVHYSTHFVLLSSRIAKGDWKTKSGHSLYGSCRMAIIEINPDKLRMKRWFDDNGLLQYEEPVLRIDPRIKAIKKIIIISKDCYPNSGKPGYHIWKREKDKLLKLAEKFERLWPLHILAKEYPKGPPSKCSKMKLTAYRRGRVSPKCRPGKPSKSLKPKRGTSFT